MFDDLTDLYQQVILDHSKSPRNFHKMEAANRTAHRQCDRSVPTRHFRSGSVCCVGSLTVEYPRI